jgi:serine/threonine-protein kinase
MRWRWLAGGIVLGCGIVPARAAAGPAEDRAAADALFTEGRALMKAGKLADACPKLAASQKLDPALGTLLNLGDCYERNGQTASAWSTFNELGAAARKVGDKRAEEALRRAGLLEPKLSKLTLTLAPGDRTDGLEVRRNGRPLDPALLGSAIPVDPGEQLIEASAPGRQPWSTRLQVEAKPGVTSVQLPTLAVAVEAVKPAPPGSGPRLEPAPPPAPFWSGQRIAGLTVGIVGALGLGVATAAGVAAIGQVNQIKSTHACNGADPPQCTKQGLEQEHGANGTANISNALFAVGGAALVTGVVLFATASRAPKASSAGLSVLPVVGPRTAGLTLQGAW